MRTSFSNLSNSVWKLKFLSKFSAFKLYILSFLVMEFASVSIVLYSFLTGFILNRSINYSDMLELPEPVSKSALHLTLFTFIIATGYVTLVSLVTNIGLDLLSANLSHIDICCLFLHFKQVLALPHSSVLCLAPVQWKQSFFIAPYFSTFSHGSCSFTIRRSMVRFFTVHTFTLSLFSLVTFAIAIPFFWISFITQWYRFLTVYFSKASTNC